ncbi:hypothetical protein CRUP_005103 [Coryphaenoides rupestris]|nr:hypothetical protein CRUP_005103 [Coryphaenoides rupestris]
MRRCYCTSSSFTFSSSSCTSGCLLPLRNIRQPPLPPLPLLLLVLNVRISSSFCSDALNLSPGTMEIWTTLALVLMGFCRLWDGGHAQMKIPPETVQQWASVLSVQLRDFATKYSGSLLLQKKVKDVEPIVRMVDVDGMRLVKDYAEDIERMLGSKMKSVKRLAESAEDADLYHEFNATLEFDYYNSMLINSGDEDGNYALLGGDFPLEENEHFNQLLVNTQQSDIQVPTNVYNRDPNILNGIYNSEALNDVFISNFQKDPTLTWQYFGSSTGFFRIYPGIKWTPDANGVAAYDCRNRNWYIQAATSPKDIIIMVDISGSMKGLKMTIAKHTINTILDTLGENDFVNIIAYTDYVRYVEPCFRGTLVQADLDNREARSSGRGSMCNQAIMLITDGAMEDYEEVFKEFNWPDRRLGVHGYAFLITNNGYILAHPDLRPLYKDGRKLKPKPNYNSVDLAEVEWEDRDELVACACGPRGAAELTSVVCFLSFGMVLTKGHGRLMFMGNVSVEEGLHDLMSPDLSISSEWTYCELDIDPHHRKYSQLQAVVRYLLGKEPDLECDEVLLQQTLFDAVVTAPLEAYWNALMLNEGDG